MPRFAFVAHSSELESITLMLGLSNTYVLGFGTATILLGFVSIALLLGLGSTLLKIQKSEHFIGNEHVFFQTVAYNQLVTYILRMGGIGSVCISLHGDGPTWYPGL